MTDAQKTGALITQRRREKGLTQAQLAAALGVTNKAVSKWETGAGLPEISALPPLCALLDLTVDALLRGQTAQDEPAPQWQLSFCGAFRALLRTRALAARCAPLTKLSRICTPLLLTALFLFSCYSMFQRIFPAWLSILIFICAALLLDCMYFGAASAVLLHLTKQRGPTRLDVCDTVLVVHSANMQTAYTYAALQDVFVFDDCVVFRLSGKFFVTGTLPDDAPPLHDLLSFLQQRAPTANVVPHANLRRRAAVGTVLCGCALLFAGVSLLRAQGVFVSVSPSGIPAVVRVDPKTGGAAWYRHFGRTKQPFAYAVVSGGTPKLQWLTGDACAVTYLAKSDGLAHQSVITYGDRSPISYFYVLNALHSRWTSGDGTAEAWNTDAGVVVRYGYYLYYYDWDDCVQFGKLALVLCSDGVPQFTLVLGEDYVPAPSGAGAASGSLVLCPVSMESTRAVTLRLWQEGTP